MKRLEGKVALVTGAAGGIGTAIAQKLHSEGASLILVDLDADKLNQAAAQLGNAICVAGDVSTEELNKKAVQAAIDNFGGLHLAALNAGIEGAAGVIGDLPIEAFDKVMSVNVRGVFLGLSAIMPHMKSAGGGAIVMTSSSLGRRGTVAISPYVVSKHAVLGMMRSAALEGADHGIRVNTVNPGPIETRMVRSVGASVVPENPDAFREMLTGMVPMKRYGQPEEVANMVSFLLSDEASYCSGNLYAVDGAVTTA